MKKERSCMCEKVLIPREIENTMMQVFPKEQPEVDFLIFKDITRKQAMKNKSKRVSKQMEIQGLEGTHTIIYATIEDVMDARPQFLYECGIIL